MKHLHQWGRPTLSRVPEFLPDERASPFYPQKRRLVKKKKRERCRKKRQMRGSVGGLGQELTLVFSRLCFCSHQHKHAKCEAVFHPGFTLGETY